MTYGDGTASSVGRPGGTSECAKYRGIITNSDINRYGRQAIAAAEEVAFKHTFKPQTPVVILDRYNPVSGSVYGPDETKQAWELVAINELVLIPDLIVFVSSPKEQILDRVSRREKLDIMDQVFINNIDEITQRYESIAQTDWVQSKFKTISVCNDEHIDDVVAEIFNILSEEIAKCKCYIESMSV